MTRLCPALELFQLDGNWPANNADALAKAVIVSTKIPAEYRSGLHLNQQLDVRAFAELRDSWGRLLSEEKQWREKLSTYGRNAWPRPTELKAAAELGTHSVETRLVFEIFAGFDPDTIRVWRIAYARLLGLCGASRQIPRQVFSASTVLAEGGEHHQTSLQLVLNRQSEPAGSCYCKLCDSQPHSAPQGEA